jgi:hypothetical protein
VAAIWAELGRGKRPARRGFEVALIPETLERTTLKSLRRGEPVNLEVDCMAKTVVHWLRNFASRPVGVGSDDLTSATAPGRVRARGRPGR